MSKERKAPGSPETVVTAVGTYHQQPLVGVVCLQTKDAQQAQSAVDWEAVWQSWLGHLAECGYPVWDNSTAFYLGALAALREWYAIHPK